MPTPQLEAVDLSAHQFAPQCDLCDRPAVVIAKGCMDKQPTVLCQEHFDRGLEVISSYLKLWRTLNKRVPICGDCNRPIISLDTHLEARRL